MRSALAAGASREHLALLLVALHHGIDLLATRRVDRLDHARAVRVYRWRKERRLPAVAREAVRAAGVM